LFNRCHVDFKNEKQVDEVIELITDLANNTRIYENNGLTHREMYIVMENCNLIRITKADFMGESGPNLVSIAGGKCKKYSY
jgi:hypothetical protein